jgi:hypothetical protein
MPGVTYGEQKGSSAQDHRELDPKIEPAPNINVEEERDDWVSWHDQMTGARASYLSTLSEECGGEPESFQADLAKAKASKRIDALKRRPVEQRCPP